MNDLVPCQELLHEMKRTCPVCGAPAIGRSSAGNDEFAADYACGTICVVEGSIKAFSKTPKCNSGMWGKMLEAGATMKEFLTCPQPA